MSKNECEYTKKKKEMTKQFETSFADIDTLKELHLTKKQKASNKQHFASRKQIIHQQQASICSFISIQILCLYPSSQILRKMSHQND